MKRQDQPRPRQCTPQELTESCLGFLRRKFYPEDGVAFAKDRKRLLAWVVLWPASWLNERGVSVTADRYREIFTSVMMDAAVHGTGKITYRPGYLRHVIQSHFAVHGDEIYEAAKSVRSMVENALLVAGRPAVAAPDPVADLARVKAVLAAPKTTRRKPADPKARQGDLFAL